MTSTGIVSSSAWTSWNKPAVAQVTFGVAGPAERRHRSSLLGVDRLAVNSHLDEATPTLGRRVDGHLDVRGEVPDSTVLLIVGIRRKLSSRTPPCDS